MRDETHLGAGDPGAIEALLGSEANAQERTLLEAYRRSGHLAARLDPLGLRPEIRPASLDVQAPGLEALRDALEAAYCGPIGWEIGHVQDDSRFAWLAAEAERAAPPSSDDGARAAWLIAAAEHFEATTYRRLPTAKTFSLSGAESFIVAIDAAIRASGAREVVVGGMHRGRLTQMALVLGKPLERIVSELLGTPDLPEDLGAASDAVYHLGGDFVREDGVRVWTAPHPSHLSIVAPMAMGRARATGALPLMLHTDAAFAGQGVNMELMQLSGLPAYSVGGSVHLVLDNQVGFTTGAAAARTARSAADIAKLIEAPILHVNGDEPGAALRAVRAAARYRERFGADVVVNVIAFRRRGHNEIDEPRFTQPLMQERIDTLGPLSTRYRADEPNLDDFRADLAAAFSAPPLRPNDPPEAPGLAPDIEARLLERVETGVGIDRLRALGEALSAPPEGMALHAKILRFLEKRRAALKAGEGVDWATAEALALASLLDEGHPVRLTGQDTVRGAFTQRHLVLRDQANGRAHSVLDGFAAEAELHDTPLIEAATLAFEYGLTTARPDLLSIWEAQFGDFLNVCQAPFDQFVTGGEDRWLLTSGLVMLLPHGWDGGGPDHSTGHVERVLARAARGNIQVANPSTPANYFHLLRRQMARDVVKPLVVLSPKALLRHPACVSALDEFASGTAFQQVISESVKEAKRVLLCSGKITWYLEAARAEKGLEKEVAIIRIEQLYPFPAEALAEALEDAPDAELEDAPDAEIVWVQEEPANLGAFTWADRRLEAACGRRVRLISRPEAASPAVGWRAWHDEEERRLFDAAFNLEEMK